MLLWSQHAFVIFIFSSIIYTFYFSATLRNSTLTNQGKQNRQTYRKCITIVMMIHVIIEWPILEIIIVFNDLKSINRTLKQYKCIWLGVIHAMIIYYQLIHLQYCSKTYFFNIYFIWHFYNITFIIFKIIISYFINQYCCIIIIENWKN